MNALATKVLDAIHEAVDKDSLVLPTMPEMALKVREVVNDSNSDVKELRDVIGQDAALTARVIKVANSALYRGAKEFGDLNMALMRLGMATTSTLAIGLAMEQMFQATTDMVDKRLRKIWTESSEIAGMSTVLCKHCTKLRPDQATLAGLTHKIGALPILSYAEDNPLLLKDSITLDRIINAIHPTLGEKILTSWEFPKDIQLVPKAHLDFTRTLENADYADLVTASMLQVSPASYAELDFHTVTAFERLGLDPEIENAEGEDLDEQMAAAMDALK